MIKATCQVKMMILENKILALTEELKGFRELSEALSKTLEFLTARLEILEDVSYRPYYGDDDYDLNEYSPYKKGDEGMFRIYDELTKYPYAEEEDGLVLFYSKQPEVKCNCCSCSGKENKNEGLF